ncbi:endonuclease/exonuclease/phosphatase family protein [Neobacillus kokaensis]|uniref:Endonuclease n=1 Tax=Neobacillus kokaensis TaxID=2759023 RepID=A0ABQ3N1B5_9BACI|nr:endonuclease/exonuclease/phosphatase family protein [Neobacillus kokaensis]GHH97879.1 endonuclease [Neobacillus kokaensis]
MKDQLLVMSYNLKNAYDVTPNSWAERKGMVRDLLQQNSPDLIGTQECLYNQVTDMLEMLPDYDWVGLGREGGCEGEYAAIFYKKDRFHVLESGHFWLSDTPERVASVTWGHVVTRIVTWVKFMDRKNNQLFYHFNTHFDHESSVAREKSAHLLLQTIGQIDENLPVILTGDFNAEHLSKPYTILTKEGALSDTWFMTNKRLNEEKGTFNDYCDPNGGSDRIDWILVRGSIKVDSVGIIADCPDGRFPSDHFPIVATLDFT